MYTYCLQASEVSGDHVMNNNRQNNHYVRATSPIARATSQTIIIIKMAKFL